MRGKRYVTNPFCGCIAENCFLKLMPKITRAHICSNVLVSSKCVHWLHSNSSCRQRGCPLTTGHITTLPGCRRRLACGGLLARLARVINAVDCRSEPAATAPLLQSNHSNRRPGTPFRPIMPTVFFLIEGSSSSSMMSRANELPICTSCSDFHPILPQYCL